MKKNTSKSIIPKSTKPKRALIANLFFGPVEAIKVKQVKGRVYFLRMDNNKEISFALKDVGESVFIKYFKQIN
jgi:hypothetical protein